MRKSILILILTLWSFIGYGQISSLPSNMGSLTFFRENPASVTVIMPVGYPIETPVVTEVWQVTGTTGSKVSSVTPSTTVLGQTITINFTSQQVSRLASLSGSVNYFIKFNNDYKLGGVIRVVVGVGVPSISPITVQLPDIGEVRISLVGNAAAAQQYAQRADSLANVAKIASTNSQSNASISIAAKDSARYYALQASTKIPLSITAPKTTNVTSTFLKSGTGYYGLRSLYTGQDIFVYQATTKIGGGAITNGDVDNIIYFKFSDGNFGIRKFTNESVNVEEFGAIGDGITDNTSSVIKALTYSGGIKFSSGTYNIGSMTFPSNKTVEFDNGAKILINAGEQVLFYSKVIAGNDAWIFDCADSPTNYSNQNGSIYTTNPLSFFNNNQLGKSITQSIPAKWFGVTGSGYKTNTYSTYYSTLTVPDSLFINDTKAIRFALTSVSKGSEMTESNGFAYGGANTITFPKGCFAVNDELYISSGTFIEGVGSSQNTGTVFVQMNPKKALFVLQAAGIGGLGGGGSAHNISNISFGSRPTAGGLGTTTSSLVRFEDQKFNLDSRFDRIRVSNCPVGGSVFYANNKNSRYPNPNGTGSNKGLNVTMHIYDSFFDVIPGTIVKAGSNSVMGVRVYNTQFYNVYYGVVDVPAKNLDSLDGAYPNSWYEFNSCNFEGIGVIGSNSFSINDASANLDLINCKITSRTVDGNKLGAPILITRASELTISGGEFKMNPTESNGALYLLNLAGKIDNLSIHDLHTYKYDTEPSVSTIVLNSGFYSTNMSIKNNSFYVTPQTNQVIYADNPSNASVGVISNNIFHPTASQPIVGNTNPGIIYDNNYFLSSQDIKSISLVNYGMKGRTITYASSAPTTGQHYVGDRVINSSPAIGQPKSWVVTVSGNPGTFVSEGNL